MAKDDASVAQPCMFYTTCSGHQLLRRGTMFLNNADSWVQLGFHFPAYRMSASKVGMTLGPCGTLSLCTFHFSLRKMG